MKKLSNILSLRQTNLQAQKSDLHILDKKIRSRFWGFALSPNLLYLFLIIILTTTQSCVKTSTDNVIVKPNGSMSAMIGINPFNLNNCSVMPTGNTKGINQLGIKGYNGSSVASYSFPTLSFTINNYHGIGTYVSDNQQSMGGVYIKNLEFGTWGILSGKVDITSIYPTIIGTFTFVLVDSITITNGSFIANQ